MRGWLLSAALLLPLLGCASGTDGAQTTAEDDGPMAEFNKNLLAVGSAAPAAVVTDMEDRQIELSSLRGKTLLLNFWFYH